MTTDEELFTRALDALGDETGLTPELLAALSHLDEAEIERLRPAWAALGRADRLRLLSRLHRSEKEDLRHDFNAVYAVAQGDPDPEVRRVAIEAVVEDESVGLLDRLVLLVVNDPDPAVREAAARGLAPFALKAELGELPADRPGAIERALLSTLRRPDETIAIRREALAAVGYLDNPRVVEEIERGYHDPALRLMAVRAMGRTANPSWLDTLAREAESDDPLMRAEAARACGEMADESAVGIVGDLVDDPEIEVRLAALAALGEIGGERAREILLYALEDKREVVRQAAEAALSDLEFADDPFAV